MTQIQSNFKLLNCASVSLLSSTLHLTLVLLIKTRRMHITGDTLKLIFLHGIYIESISINPLCAISSLASFKREEVG